MLDDAFGLYRANIRTVAVVSLLTVFPVALVVGVAQVFYTRGLLALVPVLGEGTGDLAGFDSLALFALASNVTAPLFWVARVYLACALLRAAGAFMSDDPPGVRGVLAVGWRRFLTYALVSLVLVFSAGVLGLFFIVPGVIFAVRFALAPAIAAVEGAGFETAFRRSWQLTSGYAWRVIGFFVFLSLFTLVLETAVTSPSIVRQVMVSVQNPEAVFEPVSAGWKTFEGLLSAASVALVMPFIEFAWFFFYADLRSRREGMDLVARAALLGGRRR